MIVELLATHDELFGLQMVELSDGRLKRGTVYVTLGRMQEKGYLESRQEALPPGAIGLPRRLYRPTGFALRALDAWKTAEQSFLAAPRAAGRLTRMGTDHTNAILQFARRWFDERTVANVFEPLLADHQREWLDAPPAARLWIATRTAAVLLVSMVRLAPRTLLLTPTPPSMTRRIVARMIIFISTVSGLMVIPFLIELNEVGPVRLAWLLMWLLPGAVVLAFPFAMGFAVDGVRRQPRATPAERIAMLRAAIVAVVFMILVGGWVVPAANQQFRLTVKADPWHPPARGARELTTPQLIQAPWLARAEGFTRSTAIQRELHNRASLAVLPLVLIWLRWRALNHPSPQWLLPPWLSATVTIGGYFFFRENDIQDRIAARPRDPGPLPGCRWWCFWPSAGSVTAWLPARQRRYSTHEPVARDRGVAVRRTRAPRRLRAARRRLAVANWQGARHWTMASGAGIRIRRDGVCRVAGEGAW